MARDVSIVILNYNSAAFLEKCLNSIRKSSLRGLSIETLVIDNASKDQSAAMVRQRFPEVSLIVSRKNKGFAGGNNLARNKVTGKYILFLNPDTELGEDTIYKVHSFMEANEEVGVASCKLVLANGRLDYSAHRGFPTPANAFFYFFTPLARIFPRVKLFTGYTQAWKLSDPNPHEVDAVSGAFFFVRKAAADEVGWWDEDYFWYGEDLEFCYCLKEKGWKVIYLPGVSILHHKGVTAGIKGHSKGLSTASRETKLRSALASTQVMRIFYKKHYQKKYPKLVNFIVLTGIALLEKIRTSRI